MPEPREPTKTAKVRVKRGRHQPPGPMRMIIGGDGMSSHWRELDGDEEVGLTLQAGQEQALVHIIIEGDTFKFGGGPYLIIAGETLELEV